VNFWKLIEAFFKAVTWSSLSGIGNSRLAQLTVLMPVVGYLVLFNSNISLWFETVIPQRPTTETASIWEKLFENNLLYLYLGLLVFGLAVSLFNIVAPRQIKQFPATEDYIQSMVSIATKNVVIGSFLNVHQALEDHLSEEEQSPMHGGQSVAFPNDMQESLHRLVDSTFRENIVIAEEHDSWDESTGERYFTGSGYLQTDVVLQDMTSGTRVSLAFRELMLQGISKHPNDVFYLEHHMLENSRPMLRALVFVMFAIGMMLTAFPTFLTTMIILSLL
jgi:hypothetical protein